MLRGAAAHVARLRLAPRRALSTSPHGTSPSSTTSAAATKTAPAAEREGVEALESATPGITRIRKGKSGKVVEVDSTIARIIGSDWGDRRNQSVSLPMRLYWLLFGVVLANGAYTYFTGKDETYLVEKIQKKVDEKLGVVETNEFVVMADQPKSSKPAKTTAKDDDSSKPAVGIAETRTSPPTSMFSSSAAVTTTPFFHPSATASAGTQRPKSKSELQTQLQQLRVKQQQLREELQSGNSFRDLDDVEVEIRLLDQQKAQLKRMVKRL